MTDYTLTDEQRKRLTEFLGEPYHNLSLDLTYCDTCRCIVQRFTEHENRTFDTPQDAHDLAKKLVEVGKWDEFEYKVDQTWLMIDSPEVSPSDWGKVAWLYLDDARFCYLVNAYLEEK
jgi:hypothetical protein